MSSIVSRRPPVSGSVSQAKDFFWMWIRLGTSRAFERRAKLRRVRGASTGAKTATPRAVESEQRGSAKARPAKIAHGIAALCGGRSALTDPALENRVCGAVSPSNGRLRLSADRRSVPARADFSQPRRQNDEEPAQSRPFGKPSRRVSGADRRAWQGRRERGLHTQASDRGRCQARRGVPLSYLSSTEA